MDAEVNLMNMKLKTALMYAPVLVVTIAIVAYDSLHGGWGGWSWTNGGVMVGAIASGVVVAEV